MKLIPLLTASLTTTLVACGLGMGDSSSSVNSSSTQLSATSSLSVSSNALSSNIGASSSSAQHSSVSTDDPDDKFRLVFRDDFEFFDPSRWQLMHHSWDTNIALFSDQTVKVEDGYMTLTLLPAPAGTTSEGLPKQFLGAEVRSIDTIRYGRISTRAKLAKGSAVVSAFVSIYTPWPADNWNEFDIESLGKNTREIQFNAMVYDGPANPSPNVSVAPTQFPALKTLPFDTSENFHTYTIEWTPTEAVFSIDDRVYHRWNTKMELMGLPQNILLTIWASNLPEWAGAVNETTANAKAIYDWVEVWEYKD